MNFSLKIFFICFFCPFVLARAEDLPNRKPVPALPKRPNLEVPFSEKQLTRVDPHGAKDKKPTAQQVKTTNECLVCHEIEKNKLSTKSLAQETCMNCHNQYPHSGIVEHEKHKIACTNCHSFHRGDSLAWTPESGIFKSLHNKKLEEGLIEKSSRFPMLKKNCNGCHKQ